MKDITWEKLFKAAENAMQGERIISPFAKGGYVSTAISTDKGNIYTAVNVDLRCALGICSERLAAYKLFEANKNEKIQKLVCLYRNQGPSLPCGACREFLMQLGKDWGEAEILLDLKTLKTVKLKDTMHPWWGESRYDK